MNSTAILLLIASLSSLVLGMLAWRRTSSRPLFASTLFGTFGLLAAAADALPHHHHMQMAFTIALLVAMLFAGRGGAFLWRSRKEPDLGAPAFMLSGVAMLAAFGAINAFLNL
ncbi:MAG TPA: hypothetical protein VHY22_04335 [Chthoniobacteraceae bacterium]|nr:hypothetical protein [Chthoniobacteraceae bacterium]